MDGREVKLLLRRAVSSCSSIGIIVPLITSLRSMLYTDPSEPQIGALKTFASLLAEQLKNSVVKALCLLKDGSVQEYSFDMKVD
jgi:hypothetical protein